LKRNPEKCTEAGINKQTEYTKELMREIPIGKCVEAGDKCNRIIRIMGEN